MGELKVQRNKFNEKKSHMSLKGICEEAMTSKRCKKGLINHLHFVKRNSSKHLLQIIRNARSLPTGWVAGGDKNAKRVIQDGLEREIRDSLVINKVSRIRDKFFVSELP